jgi:hypothetical protein
MPQRGEKLCASKRNPPETAMQDGIDGKEEDLTNIIEKAMSRV